MCKHLPMVLVLLIAMGPAMPAGAQLDADYEDEVQEGQPPRRGVDDRIEDEAGSEVPPRHHQTQRFPARDERDANLDDQFEEGVPETPIERGRYLTHSVAMCVICHTPKNEQGLPIDGQHFEGGVIPAAPTDPNMRPWAEFAPALGPLVNGNEDDVITLLTTGIRPRTGDSPRPPMPPFRFTEEDARAIVEYLQSLEL